MAARDEQGVKVLDLTAQHLLQRLAVVHQLLRLLCRDSGPYGAVLLSASRTCSRLQTRDQQ